MIVVILVLAIMISMIPFRMQSLQAHTKFSINMNDREDFWQKSVTRMRQSNRYQSATIRLNSWSVIVMYTGVNMSWIVQPSEHFFPAWTFLTLTWNAEWTIGAYWLSCPWYTSWFQFSSNKNTMCYRIDTNSCNLLKISCNSQ